jgi:sulfate adenylyltransferase
MTQSLYITDTSKRQKLLDDSIGLQSLTLNDRQINDLEMILSGAFYPLAGFMNEDDYLSVISDMRLSDGKLFPLPIYLDFDSALFKFKLGEEICLRDQEGLTLAVIKIDSIFKLNKDLEASEVYKTNDLNHPAVYYLNNQTGD